MSEVKVDTISERTAANGVSIDGVTIKDSGLTIPSGGEIDIASGGTLDVNGTLDVTGATVSGLTTGTILQVKSYSAAISFSGTGNSSLSVSITPSNSSNKIFIIATLAHASSTGSDGHNAYFGFKRDSTDLGWYAYKQKDGSREGGHTLSFLDSPSSTSALAYLVHGSTATITNQANSTITVFEVSP